MDAGGQQQPFELPVQGFEARYPQHAHPDFDREMYVSGVIMASGMVDDVRKHNGDAGLDQLIHEFLGRPVSYDHLYEIGTLYEVWYNAPTNEVMAKVHIWEPSTVSGTTEYKLKIYDALQKDRRGIDFSPGLKCEIDASGKKLFQRQEVALTEKRAFDHQRTVVHRFGHCKLSASANMSAAAPPAGAPPKTDGAAAGATTATPPPVAAPPKDAAAAPPAAAKDAATTPPPPAAATKDAAAAAPPAPAEDEGMEYEVTGLDPIDVTVTIDAAGNVVFPTIKKDGGGYDKVQVKSKDKEYASYTPAYRKLIDKDVADERERIISAHKRTLEELEAFTEPLKRVKYENAEQASAIWEAAAEPTTRPIVKPLVAAMKTIDEQAATIAKLQKEVALGEKMASQYLQRQNVNSQVAPKKDLPSTQKARNDAVTVLRKQAASRSHMLNTIPGVKMLGQVAASASASGTSSGDAPATNADAAPAQEELSEDQKRMDIEMRRLLQGKQISGFNIGPRQPFPIAF